MKKYASTKEPYNKAKGAFVLNHVVPLSAPAVKLVGL